MNALRRFVRWLGFGNTQQSEPRYTGDDKARRNMYPDLSDEEYRKMIRERVNRRDDIGRK